MARLILIYDLFYNSLNNINPIPALAERQFMCDLSSSTIDYLNLKVNAFLFLLCVRLLYLYKLDSLFFQKMNMHAWRLSVMFRPSCKYLQFFVELSSDTHGRNHQLLRTHLDPFINFCFEVEFI